MMKKLIWLESVGVDKLYIDNHIPIKHVDTILLALKHQLERLDDPEFNEMPVNRKMAIMHHILVWSEEVETIAKRKFDELRATPEYAKYYERKVREHKDILRDKA